MPQSLAMADVCVNKFVPEFAQLLQFRHWGSVGFNLKGLVVVQNFLYLGHRLERHRLTLGKKNTGRQHSTQDNNPHCLSFVCYTTLETTAMAQSG